LPDQSACPSQLFVLLEITDKFAGTCQAGVHPGFMGNYSGWVSTFPNDENDGKYYDDFGWKANR